MLLRLSRLSTGLAAAAVGLMAFGPGELRPLGADLAVALVAAAFLLWRLSAALERRLAQQIDPALPSLRLGAAALSDAHAAVTGAAASAPSFEAALLGVGVALRGELGPRQMRAYRVEAGEQPNVSELFVERPGFRGPARALPGGASLTVRAVAEARPCFDLPRAVALPVLHRGVAVALLELTDIELAVDENALAELMTAAGAALAARADEPLAIVPERSDSMPGVSTTELRTTLIVGAGSC